ncbi:MAG: NTP transferase domain-containing protein [Bacteroidota bacterium]
MAQKKHQKHAKLAKPNLGFFGRQEWAIVGTSRGNIQQLAYAITKALAPSYQVSYVDADHQNADDQNIAKKAAIHLGAAIEYTGKITHHRFETNSQLSLSTYQFRQFFNESDLVLVNGNHFPAKRQIVVIDPKKEKSLAKKLDCLTDVGLILMVETTDQVPDYLQEHLPNLSTIPTLNLSDTAKIIDFLRQSLVDNLPPLYGLVLAGGKSQRMGQNKGLIDYHGKPQREYMADLLSAVCEQTFLSVRTSQDEISDYSFLEDTFSGLGPFGAIASAFRRVPNAAWLVVACDLPLLNQATLKTLVDARNPSAVATAFNSPVTEFPEPLICIWEPKSYPILLQFLTQGYSCPRKVLINSNVHLLDASDPQCLMNVNRPEEMKEVQQLLKFMPQ